MARCRVCMAERPDIELNENDGRCRGCRDAKDATDLGTTYGRLVGLRNEQGARLLLAQQKLEKRIRGFVKMRTCPICGKEFTYQRDSKLYCSDLCRANARYEKARGNKSDERKCVVCGNKLRDNRSIYCSEWCKYRAADDRYREKLEARKKK